MPGCEPSSRGEGIGGSCEVAGAMEYLLPGGREYCINTRSDADTVPEVVIVEVSTPRNVPGAEERAEVEVEVDAASLGNPGKDRIGLRAEEIERGREERGVCVNPA